ncbi:MAG TPA: methyltransferase [Terracidiphilus sp.]|nr:methyltransferase [Terracidiphilus sp.]
MSATSLPESAASASGEAIARPDHILQIGLGFWASKALLSAVEMEVFTELAKHPEDLETLTGRLGLHPRSARDFLDALVALGFLLREDGVYSNTPAADLYLDKHKPSYIGGMLEMANRRLYGHWNRLTTALRTGQMQGEAGPDGTDEFAAIYADPDRLKVFLRAMTGVSRGANLAIAAKFPWAKYRTVVDVGPAQGDLLVQVMLHNKHLIGIGFDLPEVGPVFEEYVEEHGLAERLQFEGGTFFTDPLPKADVVMMGHILHDWNLDEKRMLVRKAYEALPEGGAFIAYDSVIDDERRKNSFGLLMSLNMLIESRGGFDYTGAECIGWMKDAGFREARVEHLVGPDSMVVGIK